MGNSTFEQTDFGAGIYRGRKAPPNSAYNLVNALIDDEGQPFLRGKSAYKSNTNAGATLLGIFDGHLDPGPRTLFWSASRIWTLSGDDATPVEFTSPSAAPNACARGYTSGGVLFLSCSDSARDWLVWGGSRKPAEDLTTPTVTLTQGDATMTSSGTSWSTKYEAGALVGAQDTAGGLHLMTVKSVDSNTQITLSVPWPAETASTTATIYNWTVANSGTTPFFFPLAVGSPARLLFTDGQRIFFTEPGTPSIATADLATNYHEIGSAAKPIGRAAIQDTAIWFTTDGVWTISNLSFDPVDDAGNVQHIVQQVSKDVILWGDPGIAAWAGALIVPAVDDVYLFSVDGETQPVSEAIRPLYRSYVKAGYQPGMASVHRGHYLLPVLNGTTLVDTLVCRLDRPPRPWVRWAGHATGIAYAQRVGSTTRAPKLLSISGQRVTDLTACMDPVSSLQDADSTTPTFTVETNDYDTGPGIRPNTTEKVRTVYETTGGTPTVDLASATGAEGSSYTNATLKRGGGASTGTDYSAWRVSRKAERIRFRVQCSSQVTSLILRRLELTIRQAGQT